jgi:hypothetical protein
MHPGIIEFLNCQCGSVPGGTVGIDSGGRCRHQKADMNRITGNGVWFRQQVMPVLITADFSVNRKYRINFFRIIF